MSDFAQPLGNVIKQAREKQELTQAQLASMINIDARTVLNIENYKGNPKMEVLYPLIRALKIDPNLIFYPERQHRNSDLTYLYHLLDTCTEQEAAALIQIMETVLTVLRANQPAPHK